MATRMNTWEFAVEGLPPRDLMPNNSQGRHWATRYHAGERWAKVVTLAAMQHNGRRGWPHFERVRIELEFVVPNTRVAYDPDNLVAACKPAIDALSRRVLRDDSHLYVASVTGSARPAAAGEHVHIRFRFTEVGPEE